jgi:hypothetical protein
MRQLMIFTAPSEQELELVAELKRLRWTGGRLELRRCVDGSSLLLTYVGNTVLRKYSRLTPEEYIDANPRARNQSKWIVHSEA